MKKYSPQEIASFIEHTLLRPDIVERDILRLCEEAIRYGFHSICIHPSYIKKARGYLKENKIKITTVTGFPLGATLTSVKVYESLEAVMLGADELDIVINIGMVKESKWDNLRKELQSIIMATPGIVHKIILETGYLSEEETKNASLVSVDCGAEFIKTSTGFGPRGASVRDVEIIRYAIKDRASIKAAGGIRSLRDVISFLETGVERVGTSSGATIMKEAIGVR